MGWGVSECHLGLFVIRCLMTLPPAVAPGASGWRGLADTSGTARRRATLAREARRRVLAVLAHLGGLDAEHGAHAP